jgi:hypothetical protein
LAAGFIVLAINEEEAGRERMAFLKIFRFLLGSILQNSISAKKLFG